MEISNGFKNYLNASPNTHAEKALIEKPRSWESRSLLTAITDDIERQDKLPSKERKFFDFLNREGAKMDKDGPGLSGLISQFKRRSNMEPKQLQKLEFLEKAKSHLDRIARKYEDAKSKGLQGQQIAAIQVMAEQDAYIQGLPEKERKLLQQTMGENRLRPGGVYPFNQEAKAELDIRFPLAPGDLGISGGRVKTIDRADDFLRLPPGTKVRKDDLLLSDLLNRLGSQADPNFDPLPPGMHRHDDGTVISDLLYRSRPGERSHSVNVPCNSDVARPGDPATKPVNQPYLQPKIQSRSILVELQ